jgi:hypothetical protein
MAKQGSQSTGDDYFRTPGVVEHRQRVLGTGQELARQVGNRWEAVELSDPVDSREQERCRHFDRRQEQQQLLRALPRLCVGSPPPSYEPSTPCESP